MKSVLLPAAIALAATLAACERPASTTSSTTVVQPTKERETVVQRDVPVAPAESNTTIVNPPAPAPAPSSSSTSVTIDASKPEATTERERTTSSKRVETPLGTIEKSTTETSRTTRQ